MSYQSSPLWPAALCHLISSTRASCDCINTSLSQLDAVEILMSDYRKGSAPGTKVGRLVVERKGVGEWGGEVGWGGVASPVAWLNFLICVRTLA